ncbi:large subunit ribosomal protein L4 [Rhodobium orientis]|uniref:Large ribosomal subunit protein uL4 n=1 Tax=Rhodobium orientis TaxID=34017 RepID=A0A327JGC7_9HYPH|nr:50S ribosomal protein L4 [Rhodobium orientis]MBB4301610.1 large subunit ribosomal protein L4 [Rhodobium orientis]MBK5952305.1 50S ribosomal protein L4 [Rhodobium orientis]RAI24746.1 50S ribosomal protein L4 [Rhodobium orientis]
MDIEVKTLDGASAGSLTLSDEVFGLEPRGDILQRVVRWQLAKRQAGTHKTKGRAEIARTGKKFGRQKGGGGARHGSRRAPIFVGGGRAHGPVVRSHAHDLPKKVRALGLRLALSEKARAESLIVVDDVKLDAAKTKALREKLGSLGLTSALVIDGAELNEGFAMAARNIPQLDVLPVAGANVYDILRRDKLVLTKAAVAALEERFK